MKLYLINIYSPGECPRVFQKSQKILSDLFYEHHQRGGKIKWKKQQWRRVNMKLNTWSALLCSLMQVHHHTSFLFHIFLLFSWCKLGSTREHSIHTKPTPTLFVKLNNESVSVDIYLNFGIKQLFSNKIIHPFSMALISISSSSWQRRWW